MSGAVAEKPVPVDPGVGAWIEQGLDTDPERGAQVGAVVPRGFARVVRVLHPAGDGRSWAQAAQEHGTSVHPLASWHKLAGLPDLGRSGSVDPSEDSAPAETLAAILNHCPGDEGLYQAVWSGFGAWEHEPAPGSLLMGHYVFRTPRKPLTTWPGMEPLWPQSANMIWPDDHAWFITTPLDRDSTLVAGSDDLAENVLADARLETFEVHYNDVLSIDGDTVNPAQPWMLQRYGDDVS